RAAVPASTRFFSTSAATDRFSRRLFATTASVIFSNVSTARSLSRRKEDGKFCSRTTDFVGVAQLLRFFFGDSRTVRRSSIARLQPKIETLFKQGSTLILMKFYRRVSLKSFASWPCLWK